MHLTDREIASRLDDGDLVIDPIDDFELQIQPSSVDVRLDNDFLQFTHTTASHIDPNDPEAVSQVTREVTIPEDEAFVLHPGDFILGTTREHVEIPADLLAKVAGRSTFGRLGVIIHATAGIIDPGYRGQITLEISNLGKVPVKLKPGSRIAQILFTDLTGDVERPYGEERGSKYQDQHGPVASRIGDDPEFGEE